MRKGLSLTAFGALILTATLGPRPANAAPYSADFESATKGSYAAATVNLNGIDWTFDNALVGDLANDKKNGTRSARLRHQTALAATLTMLADKPDGIGQVSLQYAKYGTDTAAPTLVVEYSTDGGGVWTPAGGDINTDSAAALTPFSADINQPGAVRLRIRSSAGGDGKRANLDDILLTDYGSAASNRPPTLTPIGNRNVAQGGTLEFLVKGTDPDGTGQVTVRAENLPSGATFPPATALGSASNLFTWANAAPAGNYDMTFYAEDEDGTNQETVTIQVIAANTTEDLIISEYGEGTSNNKYLELFNASGQTVDLSNYAILKQVNGAGAFGNALALSGNLDNNDTYLIVYSSAAPELLALADLQSNSQALSFNGNDAVALFKNNSALDIVGVVDNAANWGADVTLVRKSTIGIPKTTWDAAEWDSFPVNTWTDAGQHTFDGGASNRPPTLTPIGNRSTIISNNLAFVVRATDPDGTDEVTLWATNLPDGASFDPITATGTASNTFSWNSAEPEGSYPVTFYATDKDGTNSESITITVSAGGAASELIIAEYGEGSGNNKYLEIFNGTGLDVDLSTYALSISVNGANSFGSNLPLTGTLGHNRTFVIVHSLASATLKAKANLLSTSGPLSFNGNDAVALFKDGNPVDLLGLPDSASDWAKDTTLVRRPEVLAPVTTYDAAQWDSFPVDTWDYVGFHAMNGLPPPSGFPPALDPVPVQVVTEGQLLQFTVTATDTFDGDTIALRALNLPAGATFPPQTNVAPVTGTFSWPNAGPAGPYSVTFEAADKDGTNTLTVPITVTAAVLPQQSIVIHFNEIRYNDAGDDDAEFIELIGHSGANLAGCTLTHYNGSASVDGGLWTYTFPNHVIPDAGLVDQDGNALGFVLLTQPDGLVPNPDNLFLPTDPGSTNIPAASLQNGPDGLVLYDPQGRVLDAIAWGTFSTPADTGDLLVDDPGPTVLTQTGDPRFPNFLHQLPPGTDDNSPQAPDDVLGDSGQTWQVLNPTPGELNNGQTAGSSILIPAGTGPRQPPPGLMIIVR